MGTAMLMEGAPEPAFLHLRAVLAVAAQDVELERDFQFGRGVHKEIAEAKVGQHGAVVEENRRALAELLLRLVFRDARIVARDAGFQVDADVRHDVEAAGVRAAQADFFLHCGDKVDGGGGWLTGFTQGACDFHEAGDPCPIVPRLADVEVSACQLLEAAVRRDWVAGADGEALFGVVLVRRAHIDEHAFFLEDLRTGLGLHDVDGFYAGESGDRGRCGS